VTTWKGGLTYKPVDDISFRITQSRDIRAPTLSDLYSAGTSGGTTVIENGVSTFVTARTTGNPLLKPEEADSTGAGFVLTPTFLPGFGMSVDYYDIRINGAIVSLSAQSYVNLCDLGNQAFCSFIVRDSSGAITGVFVRPANFQVQSERGVDFETSYKAPLDNIHSGWKGMLTFRALTTFVDSLETIGNGTTVQGAGVLGGFGGIGTTGLTAPRWKYTSSLTYDLDKISATLTARGIGDGVYNTAFVQCATDCPVSTTAHPTVSNNHVPSWMALDISAQYSILENSQLYLTVQNFLNRDPPVIAGSSVYGGLGNAAYDQFGRVYRAGFRFRF
jgi:outer membrane receptor protein involved in Fe transport